MRELFKLTAKTIEKTGEVFNLGYDGSDFAFALIAAYLRMQENGLFPTPTIYVVGKASLTGIEGEEVYSISEQLWNKQKQALEWSSSTDASNRIGIMSLDVDPGSELPPRILQAVEPFFEIYPITED